MKPNFIFLRLEKNSVDGVNWFLLGFVLSFDKFFYSKIFSPILFFLNPNRWLTFEYFVTWSLSFEKKRMAFQKGLFR